MKILAVVVTYYPDEVVLKKNIYSFINNVDKILIWENTPLSDKLNYRWISGKKIEYCGDGINSISHALNFAWEYANKNKYSHLLIMDQDSFWPNGLNDYLKETIFNKNAPEGMWGPNLYPTIKSINRFEESESIISSGMLIPLHLINKIGGWNEVFAIDGVDTEFCLRARRKNIKCWVVREAIMKQTFGQPNSKRFFFKTISTRNDTPERLYSIYKSKIIIMRKYSEASHFRREFYHSWVKGYLKIMLIEKNRWKKNVAICKAIMAGFKFNLSELDKTEMLSSYFVK